MKEKKGIGDMNSELYVNKASMQLKKGDIDGAVCSMKKFEPKEFLLIEEANRKFASLQGVVKFQKITNLFFKKERMKHEKN